eukprot:gene1239-1402_t
MNEKIGQVAFPKEDTQWPQERLYSNATAEVMDQEVRTIVDAAYQRTLALMEESKEQVRLVAELLLKKETITHSDIANLIGKRPHATDSEYAEFLKITWDSDEKRAKAEEEQGGAPVESGGTAVPDNLVPV